MPGLNLHNQMLYPLDHYDYNKAPWILFRQHEARYNNEYNAGGRLNSGGQRDLSAARDRALTNLRDSRRERNRLLNISAAIRTTGTGINLTNRSCGLYLPPGFTVADSTNWEDGGGNPFLGRIAEGVINGTISGDLLKFWNKISGQGTKDADVSALLGEYGEFGTALIGSRFGKGILGKILGGGIGLIGGKEFIAEARKTTQVTVNPRQFQVFSGPNMRSFTFDFKFVPDSAKESDMVLDIIQWFREGMYPELTSLNLTYHFPNVFKLEFHNVGDALPQLPELALTNATVNYNPNTMSYFEQNNRPVDIDLSLNFTELQPIHRRLIRDHGF